MPHLKPNAASLMLPPTVLLTVTKSSLQKKIRHPLGKVNKTWKQFMSMHWGKGTCYPYLHGEDGVLVSFHSFVDVFFSTEQLRKITGWNALRPNLIIGKEMKWQHCPKLFHLHEKGNNTLRKERGLGSMRKEKKTR